MISKMRKVVKGQARGEVKLCTATKTALGIQPYLLHRSYSNAPRVPHIPSQTFAWLARRATEPLDPSPDAPLTLFQQVSKILHHWRLSLNMNSRSARVKVQET